LKKYGSDGQIWMVDAAELTTSFFDLKRRKKPGAGPLPYPIRLA